jgi:hypothetical protein
VAVSWTAISSIATPTADELHAGAPVVAANARTLAAMNDPVPLVRPVL